MTKLHITRIWLVGVIVMVAGLIVGGIATGLLLANGGHYLPATSGSGYDFIPTINSYFWTTVSFIVVGGVIAMAGAIAQLVAWVGALINTYQLENRTWFIVLLAGGLIGLSVGLTHFAVMIAYVIAGPDGMARRQGEYPYPTSEPARPTTLATTG